MGLADHPFDLHCDVTPAGKLKVKKHCKQIQKT